VHLTAAVKKVGNSLAIFIPADKAREARIREGDVVEVDLEPQGPELLGMFKGMKPFDRHKEDLWRDRF
jgi:antitoxin component of MazEF toxin-antitoxin module